MLKPSVQRSPPRPSKHIEVYQIMLLSNSTFAKKNTLVYSGANNFFKHDLKDLKTPNSKILKKRHSPPPKKKNRATTRRHAPGGFASSPLLARLCSSGLAARPPSGRAAELRGAVELRTGQDLLVWRTAGAGGMLQGGAAAVG